MNLEEYETCLDENDSVVIEGNEDINRGQNNNNEVVKENNFTYKDIETGNVLQFQD